MVSVGSGLAVVVAHDGADQIAIAAFKSRDIAVEGEVFAVLVMTAVTDTVADVMEQGARFELNAGLRGQMVNGL